MKQISLREWWRWLTIVIGSLIWLASNGDSLFFVHVSSGFVDVSSLADLPGDPDLGPPCDWIGGVDRKMTINSWRKIKSNRCDYNYEKTIFIGR